VATESRRDSVRVELILLLQLGLTLMKE